jgi:CDP-glucose 4,6-dehydratase
MGEPFEGTFDKKNVLVTGHTGFKGSWLSLWLKELGANVTGYSLSPPTKPSLFEVLELKDEINSVIGDIRDSEKLNEVFQNNRPQFVFHLAAQSLVSDSYLEPKYTYETNVIGTLNVFEAVREMDSVEVIINITSDKCYKNNEWVWGYRETDPLGGDNPYSSSKGCSELLTDAYRKSYFSSDESKKVALASVRAGNVIGGGDWAKNRLVPDCIRGLSEGKIIKIRNPEAVRPWQFVLEPLKGYLSLAAKMSVSGQTFAEAWNFGPSEEDSVSVRRIVEGVLDCWGEGKYQYQSKDKSTFFHESKYLRLDSSKAIRNLGWRPVLNIEEAIKLTIDWYKTYYNHTADIKEYTKNQIKNYQEKSKNHD